MFSRSIYHENTKNNNEEMNSFIHPDESIRKVMKMKGSMKTIHHE